MNHLSWQIAEDIRGGCVAIGNFDGVHLGHRELLTVLLDLAGRQRTHSAVVTFHPHPISILRPEMAPPLLTTISERCRLIRQSGIDEVIVLPVTSQLLRMSASEFFQQFIVRDLCARGLVEGPNFRFGRDRSGGVAEMRQMCAAAGMDFEVVELVSGQEQEISSSRIRQSIQSGAVAAAVRMLGHPFRISGTVEYGARRGATLGFPTANLGNIDSLLPAAGVYAGLTDFEDRRFVTAVSIGPNPTFGEAAMKVECFLDGYQGSLYGQQLNVDLVCEVRKLRRFADIESLIGQIQRDVTQCHELIQAGFAGEEEH